MEIHILNKEKKRVRGRFALKSMGTKDARVDVHAQQTDME